MKLTLPLIPFGAAITALAVGCATKPPPRNDPLDVGPGVASASNGTVATSTPPVYTPPAARVFTPPHTQPSEPAASATAPAKASPANVETARTETAKAAPARAETPGAQTAKAQAAAATYTVQKGDTLFKIARNRYGDGAKWQKIAAANPGLNANNIKVGQKINLP
jgi:5'-nucleotidase/UDP-sugar diphosphatase